MTAVDPDYVTPTVAVGIGGAGCSMISSLRKRVEEEDIDSKFRFIGIDTNAGHLRKNIEYTQSNVTKFELDTPEQWDENKDDYDFLEPELLPGGEKQLQRTGALRKRRVGRYYVDSHQNFEDLRTRLEAVIDNFADEFDDYIEKEGQKMNIWVLNSLGGGTGSGSFPIVSAMIREITEDVSWSVGNFNIYGLGAVSDTDGVSGDYTNYHLNTYAALRDLRVLIGEGNSGTNTEISLGEAHSGVAGDDELDFPDYVFDKYFLQPFDQDEMSSDAYKYQLDKSSASAPIYWALMEEPENWLDNVQETIYERLYAVDTYEISVPVEDMFRFFNTSNRIADLDSELESLKSIKKSVENDIDYLDDVSEVDIARYIQNVREDTGTDSPRLTDVIPEEIELPDRIAADMIEDIKLAVGGLSLTEDDVNEAIDDRYEEDWDVTRTDDVEHKTVYKYIFYQMAERQAKEEKRNHEFTELIESKWEKYRGELVEEYGQLEGKGPKKKWQDGMEKFFNNKIEAQERSLPTGALLGAGGFLALAVLLLTSLLLNVSQVQTLTRTTVPLGSFTISIASILTGVLLLISAVLAGFYLVPYLRLSSLKSDKRECAEMFAEYNALDTFQEKMNDKYDRIDFGRNGLERRETELESTIESKTIQRDNLATVREKIEDRLEGEEGYKFEFDRKVDLPIRDTDTLVEDRIERKVRQYIRTHPSINLDVVNDEIFDVDVDMGDQSDADEDGPDTSEINSMEFFIERNDIEEADISTVLNEILGKDQRLNQNPLRHYTNEGPDSQAILQYIWNPDNSSILEAEGGGEPYSSLKADYETDEENVEIADEFRVWMMGVYTNFHLENTPVYADIDEWFANQGGEGDENVADKLGIPGSSGVSNLVSERFAYPEFYDYDHPVGQEIADYPE